MQASNESNMLLMTKRLNVMKGDVESAIVDQFAFEEKMEFFRNTRDNHGYQLIGIDEDLVQIDTALAEVTNVIAQKFQLVASVARMPTNILMQTPLEGFGSQGESEESVYHGMLESLQMHCFDPLLERHYLIAQRSLSLNPFAFHIKWNSLDTLTAQEQAQVNLTKAQADEVYVSLGAVTGEDVHKKLQTDKMSGFDGMGDAMPEQTEPDLERYATEDANHWTTLENGSHVLIDGNGNIIAGAGGKINGTKISPKSKSGDVESHVNKTNKLASEGAKKFGGSEKDYLRESSRIAKAQPEAQNNLTKEENTSRIKPEVEVNQSTEENKMNGQGVEYSAAKEREYDRIHNEGGEGFNPYRDNVKKTEKNISAYEEAEKKFNNISWTAPENAGKLAGVTLIGGKVDIKPVAGKTVWGASFNHNGDEVFVRAEGKPEIQEMVDLYQGALKDKPDNIGQSSVAKHVPDYFAN
jgi:hypothetical protein